MPELPEVETIARGLRQVLPGRRILSARLGKTDFIDDPAALERDLPGKRIMTVRRFGKFLLLDLESSNRGESIPQSLLVHLGMTGRLVVVPAEAPILPHTHVFLALDDGRELRYTDIRRFGRMGIISTDERDTELAGLGLEPLEATEEQFSAALRGRRARMKALLLDQSVFRGIGNIYADESLWRARIHPMRLATSLSSKELRDLHRSVRAVLTEAIRMRGSSISDYVDSEGRRGGFQIRHRVYQRHGKKCSRCGSTIQRAIVAGRGTHFCLRCQKLAQKSPKASRKLQRRGKTKTAPKPAKTIA